MAVIYQSKNFLVQAPEAPLVDRNDGGHITIDPLTAVCTRQELHPKQAVELMRLIAVAGNAMEKVMNSHGVDIGRINYQDNGNWSVFKPGGPTLHYHLYGRAKSAGSNQPYGQTLHFPHKDEYPELYSSLKPLTAEDVAGIKNEMEQLFLEERYSDREWGL